MEIVSNVGYAIGVVVGMLFFAAFCAGMTGVVVSIQGKPAKTAVVSVFIAALFLAFTAWLFMAFTHHYR